MKYKNIYKWNWIFHYNHCDLFMKFVWTHIYLLLNERIFTSGYCLICTRRGNNDFIIFAVYGAWFPPISPCPFGKSLGRQSGLPYAPRGSSSHLGLSSTGFGLKKVNIRETSFVKERFVIHFLEHSDLNSDTAYLVVSCILAIVWYA